MFHVIEPKDYSVYKTEVEQFLTHLQTNKELRNSFSSPKESTFILMNDHERNIHGGAILLKNKISTLHSLLSKHMLSSLSGEVWTACTCLYIDKENLFADFESFCIEFYEELYEKLKSFGKQNQVNYVYVKLMPADYFSTEILGNWPYVFELSPKDSRDGLFHGVVSLKAAHYETRQDIRIVGYNMYK